jgi:glutamate-1-semialdehyde 2,1-aminomutase
MNKLSYKLSTINYKLFREAKKFIPGGVNSPVRSFKAVGGTPLFIKRGKGTYIYDAEGDKYLDYCLSWGALIFGHAKLEIIRELKKTINNGTSFGLPTAQETELARFVCEAYPSIERFRLVNSGTEAVMSAIRVARGYTKRKRILKFRGTYHGHADYLLVKAGSGGLTLGRPDSEGVPQDFTNLTLVVEYNDIEGLKKTVEKYGEEIAAIIAEPVAANMGLILPQKGFLRALRALSDKFGIILIFDEVITGFRLAFGGAQQYYGIKADLTCLGKILGGGFPLAGYGGKKEIMEKVAPVGGVYQAGTLAGNPVAVSSGLATLRLLKERNPYELLNKNTAYLVDNLRKLFAKKVLSVQINQVGSMFSLFFTDRPVVDYRSARKTDIRIYAKIFHALLERKIFASPSNFETWFLSTEHGEREIERTLEAFDRIVKNKVTKSC